MKGKTAEGESKAGDIEVELVYGEKDANGEVVEKCIRDLAIGIERSSDNSNTIQNSFLAFLDGVRTPEQDSLYDSFEFPVLDSTAPIKFLEIMGKMVVTLKSM